MSYRDEYAASRKSTAAELMSADEYAKGRTGVDFRAMRERIGWSQSEVEYALNVTRTTVKKWESPHTGWHVMPFGWQWIDEMYDAYFAEVDRMIELAEKRIAKAGIAKGGVVTLSYYRNGTKDDHMPRRHGEPAGAANAVSRAVGDYLEEQGYVVRYVWANEGEYII